MAAETFVDVNYKGISLSATTRMVQFGPTTAYLELAAPMPVGTALELATDDGRQVAVEVIRVHEVVAEGASPGVRVRASLDGELKAWWQGHEAGDDPLIPEAKITVRPAEDDQDEPEDQDGQDDQDDQDDTASRRGRVPASTKMMSVAEIQDAISSGGDVLVDGAVPDVLEDDRPTEVMDAVVPSELDGSLAESSAQPSPETSERTGDDDAKAKGKRKRRKRRNTRG